jgi:hypothetical protein
MAGQRGSAVDRGGRGRSFLTLLSIMVLVGSEVFAVTVASGWAIAGLLELGDLVGYALMVLFSLVGAYFLIKLWRKANAAENGR